MPKLLSPINSFESAVRVIRAGADEVYCGVGMPGKFKNFILYRGPGVSPAQLPTYDDLERIVRYSERHGVEVVVVINEPFMSETLKIAMKEHILLCVDKGVNALIIGDLGILSMVRDLDIDVPLYASTYFMSMNYEAVNLLGKLGFDRVILERHLTIPEISEIVKHSNVDVEVFCHSGGCSNLNGSCYLHYFAKRHRLAIDKSMALPVSGDRKILSGVAVPCSLTYEVYEAANSKKIGDVPIMDALTYCSLCQLPDLIQAGVAGLKIVGRFEDIENQETHTRVYREMLDFIGSFQETPEPKTLEKKISSMRRKIMRMQFKKLPLKESERQELIDLEEYVFQDLYCKPGRCYFSSLFNVPYRSSHLKEPRVVGL